MDIISDNRKKALDIINRISSLHNRRVEAKFDHYQSISQIANNYKNNLKENNIDSTRDLKSISEDIDFMLKRNSLNNANNFLVKEIEENFNNYHFKSEKSKKYFLKNITKIAEDLGFDYSTKSNNIITDNKIKHIIKQSLKEDLDLASDHISILLSCYSQICNNQNIKGEKSFWDLSEEFKKHRIEYRTKENNLEENSYAKLSNKF